MFQASKDGPTICRFCLRDANFLAVDPPQGACLCPGCRQHKTFTVLYEGGAVITYHAQGFDHNRNQIYRPVSIESPEVWTPSLPKKCVFCTECSRVITPEYNTSPYF